MTASIPEGFPNIRTKPRSSASTAFEHSSKLSEPLTTYIQPIHAGAYYLVPRFMLKVEWYMELYMRNTRMADMIDNYLKKRKKFGKLT